MKILFTNSEFFWKWNFFQTCFRLISLNVYRLFMRNMTTSNTVDLSGVTFLRATLVGNYVTRRTLLLALVLELIERYIKKFIKNFLIWKIIKKFVCLFFSVVGGRACMEKSFNMTLFSPDWGTPNPRYLYLRVAVEGKVYRVRDEYLLLAINLLLMSNELQ